jgi:hypothetical protein
VPLLRSGVLFSAPATMAAAAIAQGGKPSKREGHPGPSRRLAQKWTMGMIRMATMLATLIIGLIAGPAVSL